MPQSAQEPRGDRDAETIRLMQRKRPEGLSRLLADYGGYVRGGLRREARMLHRPEVDDALNRAAHKAWKAAPAYQQGRGSLRGWFYVIARRCALEIIREKEQERRHEESLHKDEMATSWALGHQEDGRDEPATRTCETTLRSCIAKLPDLQKRIIEADLNNSAGKANAHDLAKVNKTSTNVIYSSRSQARKALKECLSEHGYDDGQQGSQRAEA